MCSDTQNPLLPLHTQGLTAAHCSRGRRRHLIGFMCCSRHTKTQPREALDLSTYSTDMPIHLPISLRFGVYVNRIL